MESRRRVRIGRRDAFRRRWASRAAPTDRTTTPDPSFPMTRRLRFLLAPLLALAAACGDSTGPSNPEIEGPGNYGRYVRSGGRQRAYELHVPPSWTSGSRMPLVVIFHGVPSSSQAMRTISEFNTVADQRGFLVAYPAAATGDWDLNCGGCTTAEQQGIDDVRFAHDLVSQLESDAGADGGRVYLAGFSQGALAAHHLACAMGSEVAAFASVAATMLEPTAEECAPQGRVPALFFHGSADTEFPVAGRTTGGLTALSLAATVSEWLANNQCAGAQPTSTQLPDTEADGTTVRRDSYAACGAAGAVVLYAVQNGGHTWPGADPALFSPPLGIVSQDVSASEVMGEFFDAHP